MKSIITYNITLLDNITRNIKGFTTPIRVDKMNKDTDLTIEIYETEKYGNIYYVVGNKKHATQLDANGRICSWIGVGSETEFYQAKQLLKNFLEEWCYTHNIIEN